MINHPQQTVAIGGSTGLVGSALVAALEEAGHTVRRLVRRPVQDAQREIFFKPSSGEVDTRALDGIHVVVNLGGANVAGARWTDSYKQTLRDSRVQTTALLARSLAALTDKPRVLVSASAIGYYGVRGDEPLDEESPSGTGFLAEVCRDWEAANEPAWEAGIRVCQMRIGVVLSPDGGALEKMLPIFRVGMGGPLGSGKQIISWIGLPDLVSALQFAIDHDALHGAVNATAPHPVTNRQFAKALGSQLGRPAVVPTPAFALKLAVGSEAAEEMLLGGAKIFPRKLQEAGFEFSAPNIDAALAQVLR